MAKDHTHYCGLVHMLHIKNLAVSAIHNHLNYCVIFIVRTQFTNVAIGCIIQPGQPETHVLNTQDTFKLQMTIPLTYGEQNLKKN